MSAPTEAVRDRLAAHGIEKPDSLSHGWLLTNTAILMDQLKSALLQVDELKRQVDVWTTLCRVANQRVLYLNGVIRNIREALPGGLDGLRRG